MFAVMSPQLSVWPKLSWMTMSYPARNLSTSLESCNVIVQAQNRVHLGDTIYRYSHTGSPLQRNTVLRLNPRASLCFLQTVFLATEVCQRDILRHLETLLLLLLLPVPPPPVR